MRRMNGATLAEGLVLIALLGATGGLALSGAVPGPLRIVSGLAAILAALALADHFGRAGRQP